MAVYWMQPSTPVRHLDFWLPTASILITVFVWAVTNHYKPDQQWITVLNGAIIGVVIIGIGLTRYLGAVCCLTPTRPPEIWQLLLALVLAGVLTALPYRLLRYKRIWTTATIVLILGLFIILKTEYLAQSVSVWLRSSTGQSPDLASVLDLPWLGFSYLAFRWLHILRDYQAGKLPSYSLNDFVTYAIFFPTYTAGPIDRSQRFMGDLHKFTVSEQVVEPHNLRTENVVIGSWRILLGVFKKFVLADSLALVALSSQNASQVNSTVWMWVILYAYAFRIYFDFAGYTDVAIGLGRLIGFNLPENFDRPYLRQNLTTFWNSWHITLAHWFRAYFFNPVTRALRSRQKQLPVWLVILIGQFGTMLLIGLWHGITWNFAIWGVWHGVGLFAHNRWSEWVRPKMIGLVDRASVKKLMEFGGWFLTFNYVTLGWVWFALPDLTQALYVFQILARF
jgi:D-alanyl-lipoteichoic acid acyltransferase DltB (MBOAT superfamily)